MGEGIGKAKARLLDIFGTWQSKSTPPRILRIPYILFTIECLPSMLGLANQALQSRSTSFRVQWLFEILAFAMPW